MLTDGAARWLLVLHVGLGVAAVGAASHFVLWSRELLRGRYGRLRAIRRFAWILLALQAGAFAAGNAMYPTYRVEVRAAYLESREALIQQRAAHQAQLARLARAEGADVPEAGDTGQLIRRAWAAARWFDIKEHWVALGVFGALALVLALAFWEPQTTPELAPVVFGLGAVVAATLWLGAIIGVLTASWRAI
ncbi:MAG TPA: hypothetical protein VGC42_30095 [Kofleriaceae bacterium]